MKKVKLNLDELAVESFSATSEQDAEGTVDGYATLADTDCASCLDTCRPAACRSVLTGLCCNN